MIFEILTNKIKDLLTVGVEISIKHIFYKSVSQFSNLKLLLQFIRQDETGHNVI